MKTMKEDYENPLKEDLEHILSHTEARWEELRGKKIFITGGTGFFGTWFLESFAWANRRLNLNSSMLVLTRDIDAFKKKVPHLGDNHSISFHEGDVRSYEFPNGVFEYIIHAAASFQSNMSEEDALDVFDIIADGTRHTLEFSKHCNLKKFLLISSGAVYGKQTPNMKRIHEDCHQGPDPTDWRSAYGEGKRVAELLTILNARKYNYEAKIARCFTFLGPYQRLDGQWAITDFINDGLKGGPIVVKGDGMPCRSYLYAADLMIFLWKILFDGKSCLPYNVGSDVETSIRILAEIVADSFKMEGNVVISEKQVTDRDNNRYVPSIERANEGLNLRQYIDLKSAIKRTIEFIKLQN